MFDNSETMCRAAACMTFADGRNRYVYQFGGNPIITTERPQREHTEIRRSGEIHNLVTGTAVRPCPNLHPSAIYGIVYNDKDGRWARDWHGHEYLVFQREAPTNEFISITKTTPALWQGRGANWKEIELFGGFVVRATNVYVVSADIFTMLEDGDGDQFLVAMSATQLVNGEVVCLMNA